jgi:hypothetical protein
MSGQAWDMPDRSRKRPQDLDAATASTDDPTGTETRLESIVAKNPAAVALGRLGGLKGGRARADKLSPEERHELAKRAAAARWHER